MFSIIGRPAALVVALFAAVALAGVAPTVASAEVGRSLFQNAHSRKCLEMPYSSTANFAEVGQYDCHGLANQQWNYSTSTGLIQNVHSGKCLEVLYYATHNPLCQDDLRHLV